MKANKKPGDTATVENQERAAEEAQLLSQVGGGDKDSFEELHRRLSTLLFTSAYGILNNREAAEDVTQDVFLQIWEKAPTYDPTRGKAATWALTLARNKAIDRLRAAPARGTLAPIEFADDVADAGATPLQTAVSADERERLEACMRQLDPRRQSLIRAAFFEGSTYEELAQRIASPLGSVKSWIRRGLLQLRGCLEA